MNILMNIFNKYFFPVLHQTHYNEFRVTEILVVISGDFYRYLTFSFMSRHKLINFINCEVIIIM